ncbi:MAG: tRNA uridine-5-carboxymethylaminomethyl(34) synthesis GTPase MnmE [Rikenellaceae bacterium]
MASASGDIIVAPATLTGGAIAIVRMSGDGSIALCDKVFRGHNGSLRDAAGHTLRYGEIVDGQRRVVDDVLVSVFRAPHSYTGEESVEISCHGSHYIVQEIISLLIDQGAHAAEAGEFTTRAYLAGRMDLSQAEAVADMIASSSKAQHTMASTQMRGRYSERLMELRAQLLELAAFLELELDFSEEEVEFADRNRLEELIDSLSGEISTLADSFAVGNAIKKGVQVAIIGKPNAGKSTLLNAILGDNRAMVSEIAGTTRDLIEEEITVDGIVFRFIDTAGLHSTADKLELMGIERTHSAVQRAQIIIHLTEVGDNAEGDNAIALNALREDQRVIEVVNKVDLQKTKDKEFVGIQISAKEGIGIDRLLKALSQSINTEQLYAGAPIVSNIRHYELLKASLRALKAAKAGLHTDLHTDLLCQETREVLHNLGAITGEITTNDILGEIFSKFCIGK